MRLFDLKEQAMKKHAPRVKELAMQILESIKELTVLDEEMKKESPTASYGSLGALEAVFNGLKENAEKRLE